ncbi:MAG: mercury methylation corrinoid protein HgcA, partial [bacterium]
IILPQLGATGVAAHEVREKSGFNVTYGPVKAEDLIKFLQENYKATPEMREVTFNFIDRLTLVPVEFVLGLKYLLPTVIVFFFLGGISSVLNVLLAYLAGTILGPALLPWLPGRAFSIKGLFAGLIGYGLAFWLGTLGSTNLELVSWLLMMLPVASYLTMNFTGSSTYTSLSGVLKEMKYALPVQFTSVIIGIILWIITRLI